GTPYQTVQPKDVLKTPKPPSGGFENGNVYRAACYAGSHQRRGEGTITFLFIGSILPRKGLEAQSKITYFSWCYLCDCFSVNNEA
ncbi:hypothetical protein, partial [Klebsiella pneumoniae]|uniref:hypothetical protein n=1 Tax=Klebsiella pneumoniae TaxID=573 RepID=UPI001C1F284B